MQLKMCTYKTDGAVPHVWTTLQGDPQREDGAIKDYRKSIKMLIETDPDHSGSTGESLTQVSGGWRRL